MATKRRHAPDTLDEAPALGDSLIPPEVYVIGPASAPMTPGWLMGIGSRPETTAEHATRLGAAAGEFNDIGFIMGSLEPRVGWPMGNIVVPVTPEPTAVES